jgi:hypothetical protein
MSIIVMDFVANPPRVDRETGEDDFATTGVGIFTTPGSSLAIVGVGFNREIRV